MGDSDDGAPFGLQPIHDAADEGHAARVLAHRRLIEDDHRRAHGQHRGQRHQFALRRGQVIGVGLRVLDQFDHLQRRGGVGRLLSRRPAQVARPKGHFFAHTAFHDLIVRVLEDIADAGGHPGHGMFAGVPVADQHPAGRGLQQAVQMLDQCRFARAVLADDGYGLARVQPQGDAAQGVCPARVGEGHVLDDDIHRKYSTASSSVTGNSRPAGRKLARWAARAAWV